ncbi:MAG: transketolase [Clostridia bacterium]|nr:transketolase [Clostridia bacterium]
MELEQKVINTMRKIALEEILTANSGHPGVALGGAPILFSIYKSAKICPKNPDWLNRDRIVVSCGHASSLVYSTLHLFGYNVSLEDLKQFRQLGSLTPGHPECNVTNGVDCSTGALGQGFANAVGMAIAEAHLNKKLNKAKNIVNHYTFVMCGDGDLMEGISYESAALAGNLKLNKLIALYDSNNISLDGKLELSSSENVKQRFEACGWQVLLVKDGNNWKSITKAIEKAKLSKEKPTLIICKTVIGYGSKLAGSEKCHGKPFNSEDVMQMCEYFGVSKIQFEIDKDVQDWRDKYAQKGIIEEQKWHQRVAELKENNKELYNEIWHDSEKLSKCVNKLKFKEDMATRDAGKIVLNKLAENIPSIIGGSADLVGATKTFIDNSPYMSAINKEGKNIAFGVREHSMAAIANGIALHGGLKPFVSSFLVFSDYCKYAIRMSALMELPVLYVWTHDSVAVGEDGPTHQPIEQLESLRLIPNHCVIRPADANETAGAYKIAMGENCPVSVVLSRQKLPNIKNSDIDNVAYGGYIISEEQDAKNLDLILIATGSEVSVCIKAQELLEEKGYSVRVVSMPCRELFLKQDKKYQNLVLPKKCNKRISVEAGVTLGWKQIVGDDGITVGIDVFGESGKGSEVMSLYGIDAENIVKIAKKLLK